MVNSAPPRMALAALTDAIRTSGELIPLISGLGENWALQSLYPRW